MTSEFEWLCNPLKEDFHFQFDSVEYVVPALSRKLYPTDVAQHGLRRSYCLTDPVIDPQTNEVKSQGNDVMRRCYIEAADVLNPIGYSEPVVIERSKDKVSDVLSLSVDAEKPLGKRGRPKKVQTEIIQAGIND